MSRLHILQQMRTRVFGHVYADNCKIHFANSLSTVGRCDLNEIAGAA